MPYECELEHGASLFTAPFTCGIIAAIYSRIAIVGCMSVAAGKQVPLAASGTRSGARRCLRCSRDQQWRGPGIRSAGRACSLRLPAQRKLMRMRKWTKVCQSCAGDGAEEGCSLPSPHRTTAVHPPQTRSLQSKCQCKRRTSKTHPGSG
jgi:hypothetical protein